MLRNRHGGARRHRALLILNLSPHRTHRDLTCGGRRRGQTQSKREDETYMSYLYILRRVACSQTNREGTVGWSGL